MKNKFYSRAVITAVFFLLFLGNVHAQFGYGGGTHWTKDGNQFYEIEEGQIVQIDARTGKPTVLVTKEMLTPQGKSAIGVRRFSVSEDGQKILISNNTKKVWRYDTRGDFWVLDLKTRELKQMGKALPEASLMFAKFSPDGKKVAYVSGHNIYAEDLATGAVKKLTTDGTTKLINGTFDWAYEEELDCRDGFRWSPDSRSIAYWQIDARQIPNYLMLNTTDSAYSYVVPVEYPIAGVNPSSAKIGVISANGGPTKWMNIPGDPVQHYLPRMEWAHNSNELIVQQLNRAQNQSRILICNVSNATTRQIAEESDKAWVDAKEEAEGWDWIENGKAFIWSSEKDGWRHLYRIDRDGKETLLTKGDYDAISLASVDEAHNFVYFIASPENATQRYLYRVKLNGGGQAERVSPADEPGTHEYEISPNGSMAVHYFNNSYTPYKQEIISLPDHKHIAGEEIHLDANAPKKVEFFKVKTADGVEMDGWMAKPTNFDPNKKYPVVFYVYGEPADQTATDTYGAGRNGEYAGSMANDGYIYISMDNRGSPSPKGREWRKAIYKSIGTLNIRDQAMAAKEVLKWNFIDTSRVAVWGWSGGGSSTLNLMFQYPEIYKTGIAVAAVGWQLTYDDIYQERYMGVPTDAESRSYFIKGSPVTYAKNLRGNLLYVHGTGDDNVHYKNAEMLINELVKYNKQFQLMSYPNRTHAISEGPGTREHLRTLFTEYLRAHCPPGGR